MTRPNNAKRLALLFVMVATASAALGVAGTLIIKSPAQVAADTAAPAMTVLQATVTQGELTDTLFLNGTVALGNSIPLTPQAPLSGSAAIVTKLPIADGGNFKAGDVLLEVADRPLIVLNSPIPLIRDLSVGMSGEDVERLQNALRGANLQDSDKPGNFGTSTAAAVKRLYQKDGYAAPVEGGKVVVSQSEIALVPLPAQGQVISTGASLGGSATGPVITVSTLPPAISASVNPADASRLIVGTEVSVRLDGSSQKGLVSGIGQPTQDPAKGFQTPISVNLSEAIAPSSIGTTAQITLDVNGAKTSGLKVPLAAIYSDSSGGTAVTVIKKGKLHTIPVSVDGSGDGFALISDSSGRISAGDHVRVGAAG